MPSNLNPASDRLLPETWMLILAGSPPLVSAPLLRCGYLIANFLISVPVAAPREETFSFSLTLPRPTKTSWAWLTANPPGIAIEHVRTTAAEPAVREPD